MTANNKPLNKYDSLGKLRSFFKKFLEIQLRIFCPELRNVTKPLGSNFENARNLDLRLVGGMLKEAVPFYVFFSPSVQVLSGESSQKRRPYGFFGNPRRAVQFLQMRERRSWKILMTSY
jgi:hypothetical protein